MSEAEKTGVAWPRTPASMESRNGTSVVLTGLNRRHNIAAHNRCNRFDARSEYEASMAMSGPVIDDVGERVPIHDYDGPFSEQR